MKFIMVTCQGYCKRSYSISTPDPKGFDFGGTNVIYCCPLCRSQDIKVNFGPAEITSPKIKIINVEEPIVPFRASVQKPPRVARQPESQVLPIGQLHSVGRGDDEPGEGAPEKLEEPVTDGVIQPRATTSGNKRIWNDSTRTWTNTPEQYEKESRRALGI